MFNINWRQRRLKKKRKKENLKYISQQGENVSKRMEISVKCC